MSSLARLAIVALLGLLVATGWTVPASAVVDCGNVAFCPDGNACLKGGSCGVLVEAPPGSKRTASGTWCEPGFREHQYRPGACSPLTYADCTNGSICPPGTRCSADGDTCEGGGTPTGPQCGNFRCEAGRICSSAGRCMNTAYFQDCGGGTICSKNKACAQDGGCAIVGAGRTRQVPHKR